MAKSPSNAPAPQAGPPPVFQENIGGALIDSARISVMAALALMPPPEPYTQIVLPGDDEDGQMPESVHAYLAQAAQWLDAARALTVEQAEEPPTSLHVVTGGKGAGGR